jgi:hypothetical protein
MRELKEGLTAHHDENDDVVEPTARSTDASRSPVGHGRLSGRSAVQSGAAA